LGACFWAALSAAVYAVAGVALAAASDIAIGVTGALAAADQKGAMPLFICVFLMLTWSTIYLYN